MSVLVSSILSTHVYSTSRRNGNVSTVIEQMPSNMENDQVPLGVVNSMKQRLLDKFSGSVLNNTYISGSKSTNCTPLKRTTRLSRSQDSLLNDHSESLPTFLQPKENVIIVDRTVTKEQHIPKRRLSQTELQVDETPKPGTVLTVKNMFEKQIRLSRSDREKLPNKHRREIRSSTRSRSISPNDMAVRQRRTGATLPPSTSYPDLIVSHTPLPSPPPPSSGVVKAKEIVIKTEKDQSADSDRPTLLIPSNLSSDTIDKPALDFKSRLAVFNRTNPIKQSDEHLFNSNNSFKSSSAPSNFLTKPVVHRHQTEKKDSLVESTVRSTVHTAKSVTFFGGNKVVDYTQLILPPSINPFESSAIVEDTSAELFDIPEFIGGNVKLSKSSIFTGVKKETRVQFLEIVNTFEYTPLVIITSEDESHNSNIDDDDDDEFEQIARLNAEFCAKKLPDKPFEPKESEYISHRVSFSRSLQTFRPSNLDDYQLGRQHSSTMSDRKNASPHSKSTTDTPWSSISTTTADLLF